MADVSPFDPARGGWINQKAGAYMNLIGPIWVRSNGETPEYGLLADERHANHRGIVHGGVVMGFADYALGMLAAHETGTYDQVTIQIDVQFIAAGVLGKFITANTTMTRRTRSLFFCRGDILCDDEVIATATGIWKVVSPVAVGPIEKETTT